MKAIQLSVLFLSTSAASTTEHKHNLRRTGTLPDCAPDCSGVGLWQGSSPEANRGGPCNGGEFYTIRHSSGKVEYVCKEDPSDETAVGLEPSEEEEEEEEEEVVVVVDPEDVTPRPMCTKEHWNLEGSGEGHECSSNDDCKLGCCSDGQVKGRCISPFINAQFKNFLRCMPEISACELNRVGLEPPQPTGGDPAIESEYVFGIGQCTPGNVHGRITQCCTSSADCKGFGEECCDRVRLQCVPTQDEKDIMEKIQCLDKKYSH